MTAAPAPRWQRRPDDRPDEILAAAFEVFGEQGYARARLDEIAKRAGVSKGTLYLYYESKDDLFRALVRTRIGTSLQQFEERLAAHAGPWSPFLADFIGHMWHIVSSERMCLMGKIVQSELHQFPEVGRFYFTEVIQRSRRLMQTVIDNGIATGEFRPEAREIAPRAIPAMLVQLASTRLFFRTFEEHAPDDDALLAGARDLLLHGLAAQPAARNG